MNNIGNIIFNSIYPELDDRSPSLCNITPQKPELNFKEYTFKRNGKVFRGTRVIKSIKPRNDYQEELDDSWQNNHSDDSLFWNEEDEQLQQKRLKEQQSELDEFQGVLKQ